MKWQQFVLLFLVFFSSALIAGGDEEGCFAGIIAQYKLSVFTLSIFSAIIIFIIIRELKFRITSKSSTHEHTEALIQTQLATIIFENNSDPIVISDAAGNGQIITVNPAFENITGYTLDEIYGKKTNLLYSGYHDQSFYDEMWNAINTTGSWEGEIVDRHKDGHLFSKWLTIRTLFDKENKPFRRIALFTDFTDHKEAQQQIWYQANFDLLTALPNRNMFMYRLEKEVHELERNGQTLALMFLDLDNFKEVNDSLGHDEGDVLLQKAAGRITRCVRKDDVVSRLGGDEFTIILPGVSDQRVIDKIAATLISELARPFDLHGEKTYISASIGISLAPADGLSAEALLKNADQAMYAAKKEGRNQYHYFTPLMQDAVYKRHRLTSDMREAIKHGEFVLYYQPILDMNTNAVHKAEALIRWKRNDGTLVNPADFIPLSEDTGMIIEIGKWIFAEVSGQVKEWRERFDPSFQISINISPVEFRSETSQCIKLFELIDSKGLPADAIVVEITEGVLMEQSNAITRTLQKFDHRGITISIDNFGLGHSSIAYLKKFDVEFLKIDKTFVRDLETGSDNKILCEAITMMAHRLGIKVIAEGIENQAQLEYFKSIGCDCVQGYFIAYPMPANEFEERFLTSNGA